MNDTKDKPDIEETYAMAVGSANLRMNTGEDDPIGAAGVLTAAGWSPSTLGAAMMRLHTEFSRTSIPPSGGTVTDRFLLQMALKSLTGVHQQLSQKASEWKIANPEDVALSVIAWWLVRTCQACKGRKFQSVPGSPALSAKPCRACNATGETPLKHSQEGRRMAIYLEDSVSRACQSIKSRLHG